LALFVGVVVGCHFIYTPQIILLYIIYNIAKIDITNIIIPKNKICAAINKGVLFGNKNNITNENIKQPIPATINSNAVGSFDGSLLVSLAFCNRVTIFIPPTSVGLIALS
jgi:hypothetical protein